MWEMSLHERLDFWLLLKPWENRHVHISPWQQMVTADWQGELSDLQSSPSPAPHQPPCLLYLQRFWAIGVWISLFYLPFLNVLCLLEEPWAIPSCYPPNNTSRDRSQEDERCRNTGFGGRLTRVQRPQCLMWQQFHSQVSHRDNLVHKSFPFDLFIILSCSPLTSSVYLDLCWTWKVLYCFIFHLIFPPGQNVFPTVPLA